MTKGLAVGALDALKVAAGITLYLIADSLTKGLDPKNKYVPVLLDVGKAVGAAIAVALVAALLTGIANRPRIDLEWRLSPGAVPSIGAPSIPATGQIVNLRIITGGNSLHSRFIRWLASSGGMDVVIGFRPEEAVFLRIEHQTPRRFSVRTDFITVKSLKLDSELGCQADISVARRDQSTHPMKVDVDVSVNWTRGNRLVRAILKSSVRVGAGVTGFDMRGVAQDGRV